jgi:hypothetical protein
MVYCECPFDVVIVDPVMECPGEWDCADIEAISASDMDWYDTDGNGVVSYSDNIDPAHMDLLNE